ADLATIPALGTNVTVTGDGINGYRVAFNSGLAVTDTNFLTDAVTGGLTVSPSTLDGIAKITAAQLQTNLNSIPALTGNVLVFGADGGPFTILFTNGQSLVNQNPLSRNLTGSATATVATSSDGGSTLPTVLNYVPGSLPTAAQVQQYLSRLPGLSTA